MLLCVNRFRYYYYYYYCKRKVVMMMMMMNDSILLYTYRIYIYVEYVQDVHCCTKVVCRLYLMNRYPVVVFCVTENTTLKRSNDDIIVTSNIVSNTIEVRSNHLNLLHRKKKIFFRLPPYIAREIDILEHRKKRIYLPDQTKHQLIIEERH